MSSPMSSLKKPHKTPFMNMGHRPVPFRNPHYSDDESKLLDEITGGMVTQRLKACDPYAGGLPKLPVTGVTSLQGIRTLSKPSDEEGLCSDLSFSYDKQSSVTTDHELMSTMITRITQLEAKVAYQAKELNDKDKRIKILDEKVQLFQKSHDMDKHAQVTELENKCYLLQQQIAEMETFLADYGMIWVGQKVSDEDDEDEEEEMWRPASSVSQQPIFHVDYNLLLENIKDLNALAGEGVATITKTKDGARLKMPEAIQLTVYANGIVMFSGPFRPFTDPTTQICIQDILDGYFPSELQTRFPDGVPFAVTDKREVHYEDKRADVFVGPGQTLGGDTKPSRLVPTKLQDKSVVGAGNTSCNSLEVKQRTNELPGPQLSVEQFLQKLPKAVVKGGKIINIRNSIGETLQGGPKSHGDITVVETDTVLAMKKRLDDENSRPFTPRDITTIRVKTEDGNHTYILKMKFNNTIGDLRHYIIKQRGEGSIPFDIVSAYPNKMYCDDNVTLYDAGLTPNAVTHLKPKKT